MTDQIFTKWHKVVEAAEAGSIYISRKGKLKSAKGLLNFQEVRELCKLASGLQHYFLSPEVEQAFDGKLVHTMESLMEAGIKELPFEAMTIETVLNQSTINDPETGEKVAAKFRSFIIFCKSSEDKMMALNIVLMEFEKRSYSPLIVVCPIITSVEPVYLKDKREDDKLITEGNPANKIAFRHIESYAPWWENGYDPDPMEWMDVLKDIDYHYELLMAIMNTKGIAKDHIPAPSKLNKARAASNSPIIPDHIVIRIGHYYDREGREHAFTGRHVRVHWRAGHTRRQPIGPRGLETIKLIYIKPCLVNYEPGTEEPVKPTRLVVA